MRTERGKISKVWKFIFTDKLYFYRNFGLLLKSELLYFIAVFMAENYREKMAEYTEQRGRVLFRFQFLLFKR